MEEEEQNRLSITVVSVHPEDDLAEVSREVSKRIASAINTLIVSSNDGRAQTVARLVDSRERSSSHMAKPRTELDAEFFGSFGKESFALFVQHLRVLLPALNYQHLLVIADVSVADGRFVARYATEQQVAA